MPKNPVRKARRVDDLLVENGLAGGRKEALALLMAGKVLADGQRVDKPGVLLEAGVELRLKGDACRYVSRGGEKLEGALRDFSLDVRDWTCLDLGASTGGFTDCLLQHGARRVHAFDVGTGQLDWKLHQDARVVVHDGINVRYLEPSMVGEPVALITADLSYVSLRSVLPALTTFAPAHVLALVKPQFEAWRSDVEAGGLIRDEDHRRQILREIRQFASAVGFTVAGESDSAITGRKGNQETFLLLRNPRSKV